MARPSYENVPYVSGDKSIFRNLVLAAPTACQRVAMFGDRQEASPTSWGRSFIARLINNAFYTVGPASETHHGFSYNNTGNQLLGNTSAGVTAAVDGVGVLPQLLQHVIDAAASTGVNALLNPRADATGSITPSQTLVDRELWFPASDLRCEFYLRGNAAGPNFVRVTNEPNTTATPIFFLPIAETFVSPDLGLSSKGVDEWVKWTTPTIAADPLKPYPQVRLKGWNGSVATAGLINIGHRFIDASRNQGIVWDSFGESNSSTTQFLTNHPAKFNQFKIMGPWSHILTSFGQGDAGLGHTDDQFKVNTQTLIDLFRNANWGQANTPIILLSDQMVKVAGAFTQPMLDQLKLQAAVLAEIAEENENVVFVNSARQMTDWGYDPNNPVHSDDGNNMTAIACWARADALWQTIVQEAAILGDGTPADIVAAMNADPTQAAARDAAIAAAAQTTPAAVKDATRSAVNGVWTDGNGATFVLTVTDP